MGNETLYKKYCQIEKIKKNFTTSYKANTNDNKYTTTQLPSNETFYLFGTHHGDAWASFLAPYMYPPCDTCLDEGESEMWYDDQNKNDIEKRLKNDDNDIENDQDGQQLEGRAYEIEKTNNKNVRIGNDNVALSFGIGRKYSGVSFHLHGPGYSEVLHGQKRWYLYDPDEISNYNLKTPP